MAVQIAPISYGDFLVLIGILKHTANMECATTDDLDMKEAAAKLYKELSIKTVP